MTTSGGDFADPAGDARDRTNEEIVTEDSKQTPEAPRRRTGSRRATTSVVSTGGTGLIVPEAAPAVPAQSAPATPAPVVAPVVTERPAAKSRSRRVSVAVAGTEITANGEPLAAREAAAVVTEAPERPARTAPTTRRERPVIAEPVAEPSAAEEPRTDQEPAGESPARGRSRRSRSRTGSAAREESPAVTADADAPVEARTQAPAAKAKPAAAKPEAAPEPESTPVAEEAAPEAVIYAPDPVLAVAVEQARAALLEVIPESDIGRHVGNKADGEFALSLLFENRLRGYPGWYWSVTMGRVDAQSEPNVLEISLLPNLTEALLSPEWIPWSERLADYRATQQAAALLAAEDHEDDLDDDHEDDDHEDDHEDDFDERGALLHGGDIDGVDVDEALALAADDADEDEEDESEPEAEPAPALESDAEGEYSRKTARRGRTRAPAFDEYEDTYRDVDRYNRSRGGGRGRRR